MADDVSTATGTSSTPPAGSPPAAAATVATTPPTQSATQATDASKSTPEGKAPEAVKTDAGVQDATPKQKDAAVAVDSAPLFTLPDDFKVPDSARSKFEAAIKSVTVDGKLNVTPQQIVDWYVEQARDANADWQKSVETLNAQNEASCKTRFSAQQLAASETAVGWFKSMDPAFEDFAKRQLNDPVFVNAMRTVGELLSEDTFEPAGKVPVTSNRPRTRAEAAKLLYPSAKSN